MKENELRYHQDQRDNAFRALLVSPTPSVDVALLRAGIAEYGKVIIPAVDLDYRVPEHFARTVPPTERRALDAILGELREFRAQLVGLTVGDAEVLYNGDPFTLLLRDEFDRWVAAHARTRLAKPSPRDGSDSVARYCRFEREFASWVESLVLTPCSGHAVVLSQVNRKLWWMLARETWARHVVRDGAGLFVGVESADPIVGATLDAFYRQHGWHRDGLVPALAASNPNVAVPPGTSVEDVARELRMIASDLTEMKGLLAQHFRPREAVLRLADNVFASWTWNVGHATGTVLLGANADEVVEQLDSSNDRWSFGVALDGTPREVAMPWLEFGPDVSRGALGILRPVHEHMFRLWEAAERPEASRPVDAGSVDEAAAVAAACDVIVLADDAAGDPTRADSPMPRLRVPAVRAITLLAKLERVLGCEVRRGKGSEITIWRVGGKKFTLPSHERNTHYHSHTVRALLRTVGISVAEFRAAAGTR